MDDDHQHYRKLSMMQRLVLSLLILFVLAPSTLWAGDSLMLTPNRIILEGRERQARLTLSNTGDAAGRYRLFFVNYRMTSDGQFEPVTQPTSADAPFADGLVRFSPRQVELAPGQTQIARLALRKPASLPDGEYRSHLVVQAIPAEGPPSSKPQGKGQASASFRTLYGISIPVIVRHGDTAGQISIGEVRPEPAEKMISIELKREGNESVYGDLIVRLLREDIEPETVAETNGVAVYTGLSSRTLRFPLNLPKGAAGTLEVLYREPVGKKRTLAQKRIKLP